MRIFDCFTFFNEIELLKIRCEILKELNPIHVLVESPTTHTGDPKPLYFEENKHLFEEYNIRHIVADLPNNGNTWANENKQRDAIAIGLVDAEDDDWVMVSDLDEIPDPEVVKKFIPDEMLVAALKMTHYTYYLNCLQCADCWESARLTTWRYMKSTTPNKLRVGGFKTVMLNAGWHFSWMGGIDKIIEKFYAYAHTESCTSQNVDRDSLIEKLKTGESLWSQGNKNDLWKFVPIDETFPKYIQDNVPSLIEKGLIKKNMDMTLDEIALKCGTDKSSAGHNYCKYYDMFFSRLSARPINLLEIGIDKGDSLKMWWFYFGDQKSDIHGIDIRDGYEYVTDGYRNIHTHVVDHSNKADLIMFGMGHDQYFDIIIEDGSHQSADSILTFETLFPYLRSGGYYCCEDVLCDYDSRWNKGISSIDRFKELIHDVNMGGVIPNDQICANKAEAIKKYIGTYLQNNVEWVFSSCGLFIIKKIE